MGPSDSQWSLLLTSSPVSRLIRYRKSAKQNHETYYVSYVCSCYVQDFKEKKVSTTLEVTYSSLGHVYVCGHLRVCAHICLSCFFISVYQWLNMCLLLKETEILGLISKVEPGNYSGPFSKLNLQMSHPSSCVTSSVTLLFLAGTSQLFFYLPNSHFCLFSASLIFHPYW